MKTYLVGGAVRDKLLGVAVYDRDWVVVGAKPEQLLAQGFRQVGNDFPVFLHPDTQEEYALARTERKSGVGYHGFDVQFDPSITLESDLSRRDLTINAMAEDAQGNLVDPYGGQQDLAAKKLRHVSDAFSEDPLRVLRVCRFAAKLAPFDFVIAPETHQLMCDMVNSGELSALTPERVWQEVVKALKTEMPSRFFVQLDSVGALAVLFPELAALKGVEQPLKHHPEGDVWVHSMMVLDAAAKLSDKGMVRWAALMHDLGKGLTPKTRWPKHSGHEQVGVPLVSALSERYRIPKKWQSLAEQVTAYHGLIHQAFNSAGQPHLKAGTLLKVLKACYALKDRKRFELLLIACEADAKGRLGFENRPYPQKDFWLAVTDIANNVDRKAVLAEGFSGPAIGEAIERARLQLVKQFLQTYR
ncbi:MAG: multifunctional CCA addition/repair protein [Piscirickettsiaceae bacterium CG_4_9_14_3_um_filter_43_564]|nr:multifunctional CCA addition/repair protein [Thiomicrospira sp.]OIP93728.1 MAG: multifunctional CCA tRNA nucleotidyl transferase/2'3'-cyclic phosphodiesterase/2'nucleotidase/phosphatase [Thiomicrospira sp. CG2_30_44_34]PIQ02708.1 MAG: multifunctional CCA addition/repair protein [Piscirickettsiaceae bacterium CG18_big_fil_WC_8_21_14_2_50_44_103]PIU38844.1 MAG: multifunctional CCA addition/repair protein [Piscirickettsiaceae bacterium CG07_land_8_20_14_0_80_44_28]PIW58021.1 MAG: multifunctiona